MINGNIVEFIDKLYYGEELVFTYRNRKYFLQGFYIDDLKTAIMQLDDVSEIPFKGFIWEYQSNSMRECAEAFLNTPLRDGKVFIDIQEDITWADW